MERRTPVLTNYHIRKFSKKIHTLAIIKKLNSTTSSLFQYQGESHTDQKQYFHNRNSLTGYITPREGSPIGS